MMRWNKKSKGSAGREVIEIFLAPRATVRAAPRNNSITIQPGLGASVRITTASHTDQGTREYQQDALFVSGPVDAAQCEPVKVIGVLCDGMGGMQSGGQASSLAVEEMRKELITLSDNQDISVFFITTIKKLDAMMTKRFGEGISGTTMAAVIILGNRLYWGSVGDSRVYLLRRQEIAQVTRDHNYYLQLKEEVAKGKLTLEEADAHPKKEALISFIGSGRIELIDANTEPFQLIDDDIVLLCSDGLTRSLTDEEIRKHVFSHADNLKEAAVSLIRKAVDIDMGPKDNTSAILIQYQEK